MDRATRLDFLFLIDPWVDFIMSNKPKNTEQSQKLAPRAVVSRLSLYLRQLEVLQAAGHTRVSSNQIAVILHLRDAQVRKDLAFFGQFGHPGIGYHIEELQDSIRKALGTDRLWPLALVGFGNLGRALMRYREFDRHGFRIAAVFDSDPRKVGTMVQEYEVFPIEDMAEIVKKMGISIAALTVPAEVAQDVVNHMLSSGIRGILNFAPVALSVPQDVSVVSVDLSVQLEQLVYKLTHSSGGVSYSS
jgi:redox-sensing transcriptional repressor